MEKQAGSAIASSVESPPLETVRDQSKQVATTRPDVTDAELEAAIVRAVTEGAFDVARVLAAQLEERRRARVPGNVVPIGSRRPL